MIDADPCPHRYTRKEYCPLCAPEPATAQQREGSEQALREIADGAGTLPGHAIGRIARNALAAAPTPQQRGDVHALERQIREALNEASSAWSVARDQAGEMDCKAASIANEKETACWILIERLADLAAAPPRRPATAQQREGYEQALRRIRDMRVGSFSDEQVVREDMQHIAKVALATAPTPPPASGWRNDGDPPVDVEVILQHASGSLNTWISDKDEESGDWRQGGKYVAWLNPWLLPPPPESHLQRVVNCKHQHYEGGGTVGVLGSDNLFESWGRCTDCGFTWDTRRGDKAPVNSMSPLTAETACSHEPFEGRCVHCGVPFVGGRPSPLTAERAGAEPVCILRVDAEQAFEPYWTPESNVLPSGEYPLYLGPAHPDHKWLSDREPPTPAGSDAIDAARWRPISEAPRDGTWFLAVAKTDIRLVHFDAHDDRFPINSNGVMWNSAPTHWMPLPPPPGETT